MFHLVTIYFLSKRGNCDGFRTTKMVKWNILNLYSHFLNLLFHWLPSQIITKSRVSFRPTSYSNDNHRVQTFWPSLPLYEVKLTHDSVRGDVVSRSDGEHPSVESLHQPLLWAELALHGCRLGGEERGHPRGEGDRVREMPPASPVLAGHVEPVGAVAPQGEDLEGAVGGEEVLHDAGVAHRLQAIGQVTPNHPGVMESHQHHRHHHHHQDTCPCQPVW